MKAESTLGLLVLCTALAGLGGATAGQQEIVVGGYLSCQVPSGFRVVSSMSEIPAALRWQWNGCADIGRTWNTTDVITPNTLHCGIEFAMYRGNRWIVAIGQGGLATSHQIHVYDISHPGTQLTGISPVTPDEAERLIKCDSTGAVVH